MRARRPRRCARRSARLGAKLKLTFQSRFGRAEWIKPYTDKTVEALARDGVKRIAIVTPGFAADCLETLEEIAEENKEIFLEHGGERFSYIPCLNDSEGGIGVLVHLIERELARLGVSMARMRGRHHRSRRLSCLAAPGAVTGRSRARRLPRSARARWPMSSRGRRAGRRGAGACRRAWRALAARGLAPAGAIHANVYEVQGTVSVAPAAKGQQSVTHRLGWCSVPTAISLASRARARTCAKARSTGDGAPPPMPPPPPQPQDIVKLIPR